MFLQEINILYLIKKKYIKVLKHLMLKSLISVVIYVNFN